MWQVKKKVVGKKKGTKQGRKVKRKENKDVMNKRKKRKHQRGG